MKELITYKTKDGKIFDNKEAAENHEKSLENSFENEAQLIDTIKEWDIYKDIFSKLEKAIDIKDICLLLDEDIFAENASFSVGGKVIENIKEVIYNHYTFSITQSQLISLFKRKVSDEFTNNILNIILNDFWDLEEGSKKTMNTIQLTLKEIDNTF